MKKLSIITAGLLSLGCLCAEEVTTWQSKLSGDASIKFESEYVYRGRRDMAKTFAPKASIGYEAFDGFRAYVGIDSAIGIKESKTDRVTPLAGFSYDVTDVFTLDAGYRHNFYTTAPTEVTGQGQTSTSGIVRDTNEIYAGILADVMLSPSLYCFYDFDWEELDVETQVAYTLDLTEYSVSGLAVDFVVKVGYDRTGKPLGIKTIESYDYFYYGANIDLVYSFNNNSKVKVGAAYVKNSLSKDHFINTLGGHRDNVFGTASLEFSF